MCMCNNNSAIYVTGVGTLSPLGGEGRANVVVEMLRAVCFCKMLQLSNSLYRTGHDIKPNTETLTLTKGHT